MANYVRDKEDIHKQLALAKESLARLKALSGIHKETTNTVQHNGIVCENGNGCDWEDTELFWGKPREESRQKCQETCYESDCFNTQGTNITSDQSHTAADSLGKVLSLQVSKLEDDIKVSLLLYFEEMETQKEELIVSFETMHQQLLKHQQMCQEHHRETSEKEALIERLQTSQEILGMEVEKLQREKTLLAASTSNATRDSSYATTGLIEHDELSETLMNENSRLREMLQNYETNDYDRLQRKVALQEKLCESYKKDIFSKDSLVKRLQAENDGLQEDVKNLQEEIIQVNANRITTEQEKTSLRQELQLCEEQITPLREKYTGIAEENMYLQRCIHDARSKANTCDGNLSELEKEILELRTKCECYRDKLRDKERFLTSVTKENQGLTKTVEAMKKELAIIQRDGRSLKVENERLQRENADREIDRLNSETNSKASNSKISTTKKQLRVLEGKVSDLERKRQILENRECELSQEVLTNVEKCIKAEQEVYLTKKQLSQLQGFYESSEKQRKDLQADVDRFRNKIDVLEKELLTTKLNNEHERRMQELLKDKEGLTDKTQQLNPESERNKAEIKELEEALDDAREQNTVQRMRLDTHETLMKRKDERIKELQDESVQLHNQCDELTDEIIKKTREAQGLKTDKMLLEQELNLLKSGKPSSKQILRDSTAGKENLPFHHSADPASPDSGVADMEREKAIERLRKEILSQHKFHLQQPVLKEENFATVSVGENDMPRTEAAEQSLVQLTADNKILKSRELEMKKSQIRMEEELKKVRKQNSELRGKEKMLTKALEEKQIAAAELQSPGQHIGCKLEDETNKQIAAAELQSPGQHIGCKLEDETGILQLNLKRSFQTDIEGNNPQYNAVYLDREPKEILTEFEDKPDGLQSHMLQEDNCQLQNKTEHLEQQIQVYEAHLNEATAGRNEFITKLKCAKENKKEIDEKPERNGVKEKEKELEQNVKDKTEILKQQIQDYKATIKHLIAEKDKLCSDLGHAQEQITELNYQCRSLQEDKNAVQQIMENKTESLEKQIQDYDARSKEKNSEKSLSLSKLKSAQQNVRDMDNVHENVQETQKIMQEMAAAKLESESLLKENYRLQNTIEELQQEIEDYTTHLKQVSVEKEQVLADLKHAQENIRQVNDDCKGVQKHKQELEKIMQDNLERENKEHQTRLKDVFAEKAQLLSELRHAQEKIRQMDNERESVQEDKKNMERIMKDKTKQLEKQIQDNEIRLNEITAERDQLFCDLKHAQENIKELNKELKDAIEDKKEFQRIIQEELLAKDEQVAKLQNEIHVLGEEKAHLQSSIDNSKQMSSEAQEDISQAQKTIMDLKRKEEMSRDREMATEHLLSQSEERNSALQVQLGKTKQQHKEMEKQTQILHQQIDLAQQRSQDLQREIAEMRKKAFDNERKQKETFDELKDLEEENEQLHRKIEDVQHMFDHLQEEKEMAVSKLQGSLRRKENEIQHLEEELSLSQKRYGEIKSRSSDAQLELSDLQVQLIESRNQFFAASQEKARLLHSERELEQGIAEKEEKISAYESELNENKRIISDQRKKAEKLVDKLNETETRAGELTAENESLQDRLHETVQKQRQLEDSQKQTSEENASLKEQLQAAHESITDLEIAFERGEDRTSQLTENLIEAKKRIQKLEGQLEASQKECRELEKNRNNTEKSYENAQASLKTSQEKVDSLEKNLRAAKENVSSLEMARDKGLTSEQLLQEKLAQTQEELVKTEEDSNALKNKQVKLEKKLGDLISKHDRLEEKNENTEKMHRELRKELELEREKRSTLQNEVESKQREKNVAMKKVELLEANIAETEESHNRELEEKLKLKEELARTKKHISELDATKKTQEETINEMEDLLRESRSKIAQLDQKVEDSSRDNADLKSQLEELNRKLKYTKEENCDLENRLQKQKEIGDGLKRNLVEREEAVMNANLDRDLSESALQSAKKELARKDASLTMQQENIADMELTSEKTNKKLKEAEALYNKASGENERLVKELEDIKEKLARGEGVKIDNMHLSSDMESTPIKTDRLIRDWSDKLSTAQLKVTDLQKELIRDIKKQELGQHRPRPAHQEKGRKNLTVDDVDFGRPSRARKRTNRSRESSIDSTRSGASMVDYVELRSITGNEAKYEPNSLGSANNDEHFHLESGTEIPQKNRTTGGPANVLTPGDVNHGKNKNIQMPLQKNPVEVGNIILPRNERQPEPECQMDLEPDEPPTGVDADASDNPTPILLPSDPLQAPEPNLFSKDDAHTLDPFEQLMKRMQESKVINEGLSNNHMINDADDDVVSLSTSALTETAATDIDHAPENSAGRNDDSSYHHQGNDPLHESKQLHPVTQLRTFTGKILPSGEGKPEKDGEKRAEEKSSQRPYSVTIMVDNEVYEETRQQGKPGYALSTKTTDTKETDVQANSTPLEGTHNTESEKEVCKTPSQIRKEFEMASRKSYHKESKTPTIQRNESIEQAENKSRKHETGVELPQPRSSQRVRQADPMTSKYQIMKKSPSTGRHESVPEDESKTCKYHIENKSPTESPNESGAGDLSKYQIEKNSGEKEELEETEEMGKERIMRLIAAFEGQEI